MPARPTLLATALIVFIGIRPAFAAGGPAEQSGLLAATGDTPYAVPAPQATTRVSDAPEPAPQGPAAQATAASDSSGARSTAHAEPGRFVANDTGMQLLLDALAAGLGKPVITSALVRAKHVTGVFDLSDPRALLRRLSETMSLLWYDDGTSIYVYESAEMKSAVVPMQYTTLGVLRDFVRETKLDDTRYAMRGDDTSKTFYVAGPPLYVNLITAAAKYLDQLRGNEQSDRTVVKLVQLQNSFVNDRRYTLRDQQITIPGIASVLSSIYGEPRGASPAGALSTSGNSGPDAGPSRSISSSQSSPVGVTMAPNSATSPFSLLGPLPSVRDSQGATDGGGAAPGEAIGAPAGLRAIAYPGTNSVVLVGTLDAVQDMEQLIHSLDVSKRQIELSLWIIDIKKGTLDQLGILWQASANHSSIGINFNAGSNLSTLDGQHFLATVQAMSAAGNARVVSRPILLTQENAPAIFDNNQTFYTQLVGERTAQLDHVTYGTMVSVLSRLSDEAAQVEMQVDVEDGNAGDGSMYSSDTSSRLPLVNRMELHTVARVPAGKSLLIGGNTIDNVTRLDSKVPGLGDIPLLGALFRSHRELREQVVRLYLIQPRLLPSTASWQDGQDWLSGDPERNEMLRSTVKLLEPFMTSEQ
jgi:type III secretion protein C